jgi:hypothetical protein
MLCEIMVLKTLCDVCSVRRRVEFEDGFSQSQKVGFTSTTTATNSTAQQALFLDAPVKPRNNQWKKVLMAVKQKFLTRECSHVPQTAIMVLRA